MAHDISNIWKVKPAIFAYTLFGPCLNLILVQNWLTGILNKMINFDLILISLILDFFIFKEKKHYFCKYAKGAHYAYVDKIYLPFSFHSSLFFPIRCYYDISLKCGYTGYHYTVDHFTYWKRSAFGGKLKAKDRIQEYIISRILKSPEKQHKVHSNIPISLQNKQNQQANSNNTSYKNKHSSSPIRNLIPDYSCDIPSYNFS